MANASEIGLRQGGNSLPRLAERWLMKLRGKLQDDSQTGEESSIEDVSEVWPLARKCFDYLEANAEEFWSAPEFALCDRAKPPRDWDRELAGEGPNEDDQDDEGLFASIYEGRPYKDTTDDGIDAPIFEPTDDGSRDELEAEWKTTGRPAHVPAIARANVVGRCGYRCQ